MTSGVERYEFEGKLFALVVRKNYRSEGADFLTDSNSLLQLGILSHKKSAEINPHIHNSLPRTIDKTNEVLHILEGKVEVVFYSEKGETLGRTTLNTGDTILLADGGHGFRMLENSRILEVKQGPYSGKGNDKSPITKHD